MNRKNTILSVLLIIILVFILALSVILFLTKNGSKESGVSDGEDIFSFFESSGRPLGDQEEDGFEDFQMEIGPKSELPKLRKITFKDTSGYGIFGGGGTTTIRYIETESGNIFETNSTTLDSTRITNTTILQTINSFWVNKDNVVIQYIDENDEIQIFSAEIVPDEEDVAQPSTLVGSFWEKNIEQIDVFGERIFGILENSAGSIGIISSPDLENQETVLDTPLKEILTSWVNRNTISINTKPSSKSFGYLYLLDTNNKTLDEALSRIIGLNSIVSRDKNKILYSTSVNKSASLRFLDRETGITKEVGIKTFVDKCVWDESEEDTTYCAVPRDLNFRNLPDNWYKGIVSFSDDIWKINLETEEMELVMELTENIDVVNLKINETGDYLAFLNKKDMTLWGIDLSLD
jgi:hypothetical protein